MVYMHIHNFINLYRGVYNVILQSDYISQLLGYNSLIVKLLIVMCEKNYMGIIHMTCSEARLHK